MGQSEILELLKDGKERTNKMIAKELNYNPSNVSRATSILRRTGDIFGREIPMEEANGRVSMVWRLSK